MKLHFENGFHGVTEINSQRIEMNHEQGVAPYDLTYAAIGGCFYAKYSHNILIIYKFKFPHIAVDHDRSYYHG